MISRPDVSCTMRQPEETGSVTREDVLRFLRERGCPTTADQLTRWHKAGLIPRPERTSLGRGHGTRSLYPAITLVQAFAAAFALRLTRSLAEARWMVWYYGFPGLTDLVKRDLANLVEHERQQFRKAFEAFHRGDAKNPISSVATRRVSTDWGPVRRRVGHERVETVALVLHEVALGQFGAGVRLDPGDYDLVRSALIALDSSLSATLPADPDVIRDMLLTLSRELNLPRIRSAVEAATPELLEIVRAEAAGLWRAQLVGLPDTWAAIPTPEFFLLWLSLRWISPTIAEDVEAAVQKPEFPAPEMSVLDRVVLDQQRRNEERREPRRNRRKK
jgi:hypothetical protein